MKQVLCLLILLVGTCLTSAEAFAQMGGYAANSSSLTKVQQKKHKQKKNKSASNLWVARAFGENISIAKMERESRKKLHEAQLRDRQREEESGVADFFNKQRHLSNPKKALKAAKKRDHEREKNSGVAAFFEDEHVSNPKKALKAAKKRDHERQKYSGVENFKN